jgi:hypothetical protein
VGPGPVSLSLPLISISEVKVNAARLRLEGAYHLERVTRAVRQVTSRTYGQLRFGPLSGESVPSAQLARVGCKSAVKGIGEPASRRALTTAPMGWASSDSVLAPRTRPAAVGLLALARRGLTSRPDGQRWRYPLWATWPAIV